MPTALSLLACRPVILGSNMEATCCHLKAADSIPTIAPAVYLTAGVLENRKKPPNPIPKRPKVLVKISARHRLIYYSRIKSAIICCPIPSRKQSRPCGYLSASGAHVVPLIGISQITISITPPVNRYSGISNSQKVVGIKLVSRLTETEQSKERTYTRIERDA
jgi:hypothetical protein